MQSTVFNGDDKMSLTITQTHPRPDGLSNAVRRQRVYDHLYDPVYTVSSEVDHARSSLKVYASKDRIKRVPEFGCMFSELPHHPRYTVQLQPADPVPAFIDRRWRGHAEQRREALQQLAGVIPNAQPWLKREECHVTGVDRWKYFKRFD
ncbi:cilia- and flagella-associated protein 91-like [Pseudoliparis swirei]|uniref:cilia- and flagella-associated protein 91-like n=1 Tax=Pseudoliparis swirei TaxID=2059687 RepID=UPI0024BD7DC2|nr:cilia- and flagella-associated protein 91-like [Pseudoliparis swirei]